MFYSRFCYSFSELNNNFALQNKTSELVFGSGISNSWLGCGIYKYGKIVVLVIDVKKTDGTDFSGKSTILNLPVGCRPVSPFIASGGIGGDYSIVYPLYVYISTVGEVSVNIMGSNTGKNIHATITYIVN